MWKVHSYKTIISNRCPSDMPDIVNKRTYHFEPDKKGLTEYWRRPRKTWAKVISAFDRNDGVHLYVVAIYKKAK